MKKYSKIIKWIVQSIIFMAGISSTIHGTAADKRICKDDLKEFTPDSSKFIAFPGAEGHGMRTTGGKGGRVIFVTNLNDSGPGSLREAVTTKGARTILFKVSGTIELQSKLEIKRDDVTIAGQTAPGDGICIKGFTVDIKADNVIIRFLRFRLGDINHVADDALKGKKHKNIIIDHCSVSWSVDETSSFYDNENFTMQWCIISESLYHSAHGKGNHGYGGIWGGNKASFHHNLISDHTSRNPRFCGSRYTRKPENEIVDFRNNVIYNWGYNSVYGGEEGNYNLVNNYYKPGPATEKDSRNRILNLTTFYYDKKVRPDTMGVGRFYIAGNFVEGDAKATNDNWKYGVHGKNIEADKVTARARVAHPSGEIITHSAQKAYSLVLKYSGAFLPKRDAVDERIIKEAETGKETFGDTFDHENKNSNSGIIDSQESVGGWPELKTAKPPCDSDNDGMPNKWEASRKLNPFDSSDNAKFNLDTMYTNLEVYLNSLVPDKEKR